jgi:hypothetical protein
VGPTCVGRPGVGSANLGGFQVGPLRWVAFSCILDPFQLGSVVEYVFYPNILNILPHFLDKPLHKHRFTKTCEILSV